MMRFEVVYEYTDEENKKKVGSIFCRTEKSVARWLKMIREEDGARLLKIREVDVQ